MTLLLSLLSLLIEVLPIADREGFLLQWFPSAKREFWKKVLERLVLGFSDQQLVTGTSILIVGFARFPASNGQISGYHFSLVTYIAWFSSSTHLITIFTLREYFRHPKHSVLRIIRLIGIGVMGVLFLVSLIFTSRFPSETFGNCPAECLINSTIPAISPRGWGGVCNILYIGRLYYGFLSLVDVKLGSYLKDRKMVRRTISTKAIKSSLDPINAFTFQ